MGEDLGLEPRIAGKALILDILHNLKGLNGRYPTMQILWSNIIPQLAWRGCVRTVDVNKASVSINEKCAEASAATASDPCGPQLFLG